MGPMVRRRSEEDILLFGQLKKNILYQVVKDDAWETPSMAKKMLPRTVVFGSSSASPKRITVYSFAQLSQCTDNFSETNFIGKVQFGNIYRGSMGESKAVIVKKWERYSMSSYLSKGTSFAYQYENGDNDARLQDEIFFHLEKKSWHPNLAKMIGYCHEGEEKICSVYELKPSRSLYNLVEEDSFPWLGRIKVIIEFAQLVAYMHDKDQLKADYLVRNIDAAHIMVDENYKPILVDLSMIAGGNLLRRDDRHYVRGCYGYVDSYTAQFDKLMKETDVYAFGCLLLVLITKKLYTDQVRLSDALPPGLLARHQYSLSKSCSDENALFSVVHESLHKDKGYRSEDGHKLTMLALKCVHEHFPKRPSMKQVVEELVKLEVVRYHAQYLGVNQQQPPCDLAADVLTHN